MLTEKAEKGSVLGAALLISGCCIGAGMLGMPVVTREAGFVPSTLFFLLCWLFMTSSGLVLLEVALWFPNETNLAEMAKKYLGKTGEWVAFSAMLFLMYALLTAYTAGIGELLSDLTGGAISRTAASFSFAFILMCFLIIGTRALDWFNRILMFGLFISYLALIYFGIPEINVSNLSTSNWKAAFVALPIMVVSFGFQNLVPSVVRYLGRDPKKIRNSILIGSLIPLFIYLIWEYIILGLVSADVTGLDDAQLATTLIKNAAKGLDAVLLVANFFAFFAITTSFIGNALSLLDFLGDQTGGSKGILKRSVLSLLAAGPPLLFAFFNPDIFLSALGVAGSFSATILFGLIPALICFKGRKEQKRLKAPSNNVPSYQFPGGTSTLLVLIGFSLFLLLFS